MQLQLNFVFFRMFASSLFLMLSHTVIKNMWFISKFLSMTHSEPVYNEIFQLLFTLVLFPCMLSPNLQNIFMQ